MAEKEHVTGLLPAHALGALDDVEAKRVEEHLASCAACRKELTLYEEMAGKLAFAAPRSEPPASLKQRVADAISETRATNRVDSGRWERWLVALRQLFARPVWQPALLFLIVVLGVANLALWQRVQQMQDAAPFRTVSLAGTENAKEATGVIIISEDGAHGALIVQELPELSEEQAYQLWLIDDGERTDGGVFSVSDDGYKSRYVSSPQPLSDYDAFGVTIEPAGGSQGPTGPQVLGSTP